MEPALKQRLLGAAVLVALAVTFLPLLVMDPAPDSGASKVPLKVPPAPEAAGDTRTLDLPLAPAPDGRAVTAPASVDATVAAPTATTPAAAPAPTSPATAAGDYAVHFGSYATTSDAARVVASLAAAQLPAYQEPAPLGTRTVHRVRIGPYPTAADAEAARLAAGRVRSDVNAKVVVLDAAAATSTSTTPIRPAASTTTTALPSTPTTTVATLPRTSAPTPSPASSTTVAAGVDRPSPAGSAPPTPPAPPSATRPPAAANVGFAVQLGAFANADEASRLRDRARAAGFSAFVEQVQTDHGTLHRVRVGPAPDKAAADALRAQVAGKLGVSGIVRPHP